LSPIIADALAYHTPRWPKSRSSGNHLTIPLTPLTSTFTFKFDVFKIAELHMFIAIIGTRCSGKTTVKDYLVSKGFTVVSLADKGIDKVRAFSLPAGLFYNVLAVVCQRSQQATVF
jgi:hypothetical protein